MACTNGFRPRSMRDLTRAALTDHHERRPEKRMAVLRISTHFLHRLSQRFRLAQLPIRGVDLEHPGCDQYRCVRH